MDTPTREKDMERVSHRVFRRTAARMPMGIPRRTARAVAARASSKVAGQRRFSSSATGMVETALVPRSPRRTLPRKVRYWT